MPDSMPQCKLLHHGVAANSSPKVIACIPRARSSDDGDGDNKQHEVDLVYASHLMLNIASPREISVGNNDENYGVGGADDNTNNNIERIWNVKQTLRTSTSLTEAETATAAANVSTRTAKRVITCVVQLKLYQDNGTVKNTTADNDVVVLVIGFSDGSLTSWIRPREQQDWKEHVLLVSAADDRNDPSSSSGISLEEAAMAATKGRSITDIDGFFGYYDEDENEHDGDNNKHHMRRLNLSVCACSSGGAQYFRFSLTLDNQSSNPNQATIKATKRLIQTPSNTVKFNTIESNYGEESGDDNNKNSFGMFLVGTAAPRHNKIHVLVVPPGSLENAIQTAPIYSGSLTGHEDWITCFDWTKNISTTPINTSSDQGFDSKQPSTECCYLASGSQDGVIRLWKWVTTTTKMTAARTTSVENDAGDFSNPIVSDDDDIDLDLEEEEIEGEARLIITQPSNDYELTTSVYLEALLIGHEDMVTSVAWHPDPKKLYDQDLILVSASMDRSIFLWSSSGESDCNNVGNNSDGAWLPIARVGSPSGILGGPVGASLLGYVNIQIEPEYGRWIMGHAHGGALHFFSCEQAIQAIEDDNISNNRQDEMTAEERSVQWKAQPCITGHFDEVTDLCWEALAGEYLITVSNDATCRLWASMTTSQDAWIEISRPQVHGYTLSAVTSISTINHKHHLVTGADEKEPRVFDGTHSFLRMLRMLSGRKRCTEGNTTNDGISRVDRAYMPSLGLSNKDTAADGADEDISGASTSSTMLPLERDLGSTSLWPETRKLFGHNSEIARLASTSSARTCLSVDFSTPYIDEVVVASTTKARDVDSANIRLWDVDRNRCLQTLEGGHRSTVTALSFSPDGTYLASSGKDRRLCVWKRKSASDDSPEQNGLFFLASAVNSSHKRIVWSVHFCPYKPSILASGSRDGTIKLWEIVEGEADTSVNEYSKFVPTIDGGVSRQSNDKAEAVTSLAFSPTKYVDRSRGILAIGLENGFIQLWSVPIITSSNECKLEPPSLALTFDAHICHIGAVRKLAWRPTADDNDGPSILASCSSDNGCRIFSVWLQT